MKCAGDSEQKMEDSEMASWSSERREKRLQQAYNPGEEMSVSAYNAWLGGIVLYGLIMNIILCYALGERMIYAFARNPILFYITYLACCIIGILLSSKSDSALISFIGYNLVAVPIGFVISISVTIYGGVDDPIVIQAFLITIVTTAFMVVLSMIKPEWFANIGPVLFISIIGLIIAEVILLILGVEQLWTAWIGAGIFSLYIGYDFYRSQMYNKTLNNAVDSALDIYLDVINLFLRILQILGSRGGSSKKR